MFRRNTLPPIFAIVLLALALIFSLPARATTCSTCSGNELMYLSITDLDTLAPSGVDPVNDFLPVYDAASGHAKKVVASSLLASGSPTVLTASTTLDASYCGKRLMLSKTGASLTITLGAATGSGCTIRLYVETVNTSNYVISKAGSDTIKGALVYSSDNGSNAELGFETTGASSITLNGTTTGGSAVADYIDLFDAVAGVWYLSGRVTESGSETTPFS